MNLMLLLAAAAVFLAALGIYGVVSQAATQRTGEFGVRMALGADRRSILQLVLRRAMGPVVLGFSVGIPRRSVLGDFLDAAVRHRRPRRCPLLRRRCFW